MERRRMGLDGQLSDRCLGVSPGEEVSRGCTAPERENVKRVSQMGYQTLDVVVRSLKMERFDDKFSSNDEAVDSSIGC